MEYALIAAGVLAALVAYEYRLRKPDQIILFERGTVVGIRRSRLYPRHVSLRVSRSTVSFTQTVESSAKGNLDMRVNLAVTVAASLGDLPALLRIGGWSSDAVARAAKELEAVLVGHVKEFTEAHDIEEITGANLGFHLRTAAARIRETLGLEIIALTVASSEPVNPQIAEALRQREQARILEQTEALSQQARVAASRARLKADEEIARLEHDLELKRFDLRKAVLEKESGLAALRAKEELAVKKMHLEFEREELRLLKESPELLLLTPQAARLAEASQTMKNARTVVSLSPADGAQGSELLGMFHSLVQKALDGFKQRKDK